MAQLILAATTAAGQSSPVVALTRRNITFFAVPALAGAEQASIQISPDNGKTWFTTSLLLTNTNNLQKADTPGTFRADKTATAGATAIYAATEDNP